MRIYAMTATFGKLEHETLTLEPGLNVIHAPNEWGKSTWCTFLVTMLYGLDTRAKSTKTALADKERFAPWSGTPMSGRIDLSWEGRDITIERWTKGRTPLGEFNAYETATGAAVPELTAANCGQMLLGVERSVFVRAGFIRLADLPVTQDESLRRRLNALVTTGDESGAADRLAEKLNKLKNACRHNRTGLLPQAESELAALESKKNELNTLQLQTSRLHERQEQLTARLAQLRNHQAALEYEKARSGAARLAQAQETLKDTRARLAAAEEACAALPSRDAAAQAVAVLRDLHQQAQSLQMESQMLPAEPQAPTPPPCFTNCSPTQAAEQVERDMAIQAAAQKKAKRFPPILWILAVLALGGGVLGWLMAQLGWMLVLPGTALLVIALMVQILMSGRRASALRELHTLKQRYGTADSSAWQLMLSEYNVHVQAYERRLQEYRTMREALEQRAAKLQADIHQHCGNRTLNEALNDWNETLRARDALSDLRRDMIRAETHAADLQSMAKPAQPPLMPDDLTYTEAETARILSDVVLEQQELTRRLGQYQGMMDALGREGNLNARIAALKTRIAKLEDHYAALTYAQDALTAAATELQRRFAPRISARAQSLFSRLTGGRYDRLTLSQDLSVNAGAQDEDVLRSALWRSDGTADQLYLALRLAVSEELTPEALLILDDALVRFDDERLKTALSILREESQRKQVILFTCQSREKELL